MNEEMEPLLDKETVTIKDYLTTAHTCVRLAQERMYGIEPQGWWTRLRINKAQEILIKLIIKLTREENDAEAQVPEA